eukprot:CAMPEP_0115727342 /NCGR_PEP_ID=MMETSP0272-20121206/82372_1 /TAXON_ID=71861 /ORGANISM="Scrippsiella trochoidea, Strain CCMP3099" /LENGTH=47 /DNA_ID= /DNA_START= /DNA_END= /DNA_ORIENTATION=
MTVSCTATKQTSKSFQNDSLDKARELSDDTPESSPRSSMEGATSPTS